MSRQPATVTVQEDGFLDRFPWYAQLGILLLLVAVICFAVDYFVFAAYRDEADKKMVEVAALRESNAEADAVARYITEYEQTLSELNTKFDTLKVRLPEQREVSSIFENVRSLIEKNNLRLVRYSTASKDREVAKEYYTEVPNTVEIAGTYPNVQQLYQDLANYQRLLNVSEITISRASDDLQAAKASVSASFIVTAFYVSEANKQALESAGPSSKTAKPGAAGAPGAPAAAPAAK